MTARSASRIIGATQGLGRRSAGTIRACSAFAACALLLLYTSPSRAAEQEPGRQRLLQIEDLLFDCGSTATEAALINQEKAAHRTVAAICNGLPDCLVPADSLLMPGAIANDCSAITIIAQCADAGDAEGRSAESMEGTFDIAPGTQLELRCAAPTAPR